MLIRIYGLLWMLAALLGAAMFLTNLYGAATTLFLGFFVHALAGAAVLVLLPATITKSIRYRVKEDGVEYTIEI